MNFLKLQHFLDCLTAFDVREFDLSVRVNHNEVFRYLSGYADAEKKQPVSKNNYRWLYSMSKVITCTAMLRLVETGKLSLDDKVSKYLPEYENLSVLKGDKIVNAENPLLIRHLFAMRSGMSYNIATPELIEVRKNPDSSTRELVAAMAKEPLGFEPGTDFRYSLSHDVLAAVAEVITGKTWYQYLKDELFNPLEIKNMGFHPTPEQKKLFTQKYCYDNANHICNVMDQDNYFCLSNKYESGGAGLFGSADEYMKIIDALANYGIAENGYCVLKPETVELLRTNQVPDNGCVCKKGYGYALGVRTLVDKKVARSLSSIGEFGWDGAASSYNLIDPGNRLAVGFFTHIMGTDFFNSVISNQIRNLVYEALEIDTPYE